MWTHGRAYRGLDHGGAGPDLTDASTAAARRLDRGAAKDRRGHGRSNVQFAVNPETAGAGHRNESRVSRSSALASKATGFPIAKIAPSWRGYTLDELKNEITAVRRRLPSSHHRLRGHQDSALHLREISRIEYAADTQMKSVARPWRSAEPSRNPCRSAAQPGDVSTASTNN